MKWQRCTMAESARDFLPCRPWASLRCRRSSSSFCSYWTYLHHGIDSFARFHAESACQLKRMRAPEIALIDRHQCNELLPHKVSMEHMTWPSTQRQAGAVKNSWSGLCY